RTLVDRIDARVEVAEVVVERDLAVPVLGIGVARAALGQQVADFLGRLQTVDELLLHRVPGDVALYRGDAGRQLVDTLGEFAGVELARLGDVGEVALPHVVHPVQVRFLRLWRSGIEYVGFGRGL